MHNFKCKVKDSLMIFHVRASLYMLKISERVQRPQKRSNVVYKPFNEYLVVPF
ncbi:hypothetical protein HOLleu_17918 [Holothuria leucospilota]|uniref:Uncharacterized protein n=1 Tax=Holothuria leucospilota TaxID=206669 RepID=A0A9Q1H8P2_HOLLE|nr:hypothetical protein HOLleu_17918 [Holothuria leucospilota]